VPIYDYVCLDCAARIEVMHGVDAAGPSTCSACGGPLRKALSPPAIVFKGSGWAKKDARSATHSKGRDDHDKPSSGTSDDKAAKPAATEATGASTD
jgi:putative FmdB family regulatory protein